MIPSFWSSFILFFCKFYCGYKMFFLRYNRFWAIKPIQEIVCWIYLINSRYWQFSTSWVRTWFILFVCEFMEFGTQYIFCNNRNVCLNKTKSSLLAACYGIFSIHYNCIISFYEDSCCQTYSVLHNHYFYISFCRIFHEMDLQLVFM